MTPGVTGPTQQAIYDVLEEAGANGPTVQELGAALDRSDASIFQALVKLERAGLVVRVKGRGEYRVAFRWVLVCHAPAARAKTLDDKRPTSVAEHRTGPLDDPWRVTTPAHVIDAQQCRPWASAAAQCIGGACG